MPIDLQWSPVDPTQPGALISWLGENFCLLVYPAACCPGSIAWNVSTLHGRFDRDGVAESVEEAKAAAVGAVRERVGVAGA